MTAQQWSFIYYQKRFLVWRQLSLLFFTSLHFIYQKVQTQFKTQMHAQCTKCNLQQSGRVQQSTKCSNNLPV